MPKIIYMAPTLNLMKPGDVNVLMASGELKELKDGYQYILITLQDE